VERLKTEQDSALDEMNMDDEDREVPPQRHEGSIKKTLIRIFTGEWPMWSMWPMLKANPERTAKWLIILIFLAIVAQQAYSYIKDPIAFQRAEIERWEENMKRGR
jgi:hypothetical protein